MAARAYVAEHYQVPVEALDIVADRPTEYPALGRRFQVVTLMDTRANGRVYKLLVDLADGRIEEDTYSLRKAEAQAYEARYGKLEPALYQRLETVHDNELLPVAVWVAPGPGQSLAEQQQAAFEALAARYPEAREALQKGRKPMDVGDQEASRRIEADYRAMVNASGESRIRPLVSELRGRGFLVTVHSGMPAFSTQLPKAVILELSRRPEVSAVYLTEKPNQLLLNSAVPNTLVQRVWERGYDGTGKRIAIVEMDNVDRNNTFLHHAATWRDSVLGVQNHATFVASCAASFHDVYKGMAPDATVVSAGENGTAQGLVDGLIWALDVNQGAADVVNVSEGNISGGDGLWWVDRAYDYWVRQSFRTVIAASGNRNDLNPQGHIPSPAKAWNVTTVGAYYDNNNVDWSDDSMCAWSCTINPLSPHQDREKPEIVAVGQNVRGKAVGDADFEDSGTSYAAPQVAGLTALLIDRNVDLRVCPEVSKAIVMASANHNIEGPTIIVTGQALNDGAGAVNAALADKIAQTRAYAGTTCYGPCWWDEMIHSSSFPVGTSIERSFYASAGDLVRVTISWFSNPDTPAEGYATDELDIDLDLWINDPSGQQVPSTLSASFDNNYEMAEFVASQTGVHKIIVYKVSDADDFGYANWCGIALVRLYGADSAIQMKNY